MQQFYIYACTLYIALPCTLNMAQFDTLLETVQQFNAKDGERSGKSIVLSLLGPFSLTPQQGMFASFQYYTVY
jgi:hypothetical protein